MAISGAKGRTRASDLHQPPYNATALERCGGVAYSGILLPSVAQPPLPLQEFLPLQPLSLALQPPLPLQEFWPLQACFSFTFLSALAAESSCAEAFERFEAEIVAAVPERRPAIAAPASRNRFVFVISPTSS